MASGLVCDKLRARPFGVHKADLAALRPVSISLWSLSSADRFTQTSIWLQLCGSTAFREQDLSSATEHCTQARLRISDGTQAMSRNKRVQHVRATRVTAAATKEVLILGDLQ